MAVIAPNVPATVPIIIVIVFGVFDFWDAEGVAVVVGAPDGIPVAVTVGTILACEGKRELATADNDCWAAFVIDMHRVPSWSVSVPF